MENFILQDQYSSKSECIKAIKIYNSRNPQDKKYYMSYLNSYTHQRMYVPCSQQQFYDWRNMHAEERRKKDIESRCIVPSKKYSCNVRCMEDCEHCPYGKPCRDKNISLDKNFEKYELELPDQSQPDMLTQIIEEEKLEAVRHELSLLDEESRQILILHFEGLSDEEIGNELHLKRSTVQYRRTVLIEQLRQKFKDF